MTVALIATSAQRSLDTQRVAAHEGRAFGAVLQMLDGMAVAQARPAAGASLALLEATMQTVADAGQHVLQRLKRQPEQRSTL